MATWRFTVCFVTSVTDRSGNKRTVSRSDSFDHHLTNEQEGLGKLPAFLESQRREHGDRLRWVALEDTLSIAPWADPDAEWQEIERLTA